MAKTVFAFRILEPEIHPPRLKIGEVRATRNFQIGILSRRPNLDVVGFGGTKAEIGGAELNYAVMQPKQLQNFLGIGGQTLVFLAGTFRGSDFDQFHFIELMDTKDAPRFTT